MKKWIKETNLIEIERIKKNKKFQKLIQQFASDSKVLLIKN